jgi:hypothetical protein
MSHAAGWAVPGFEKQQDCCCNDHTKRPIKLPTAPAPPPIPAPLGQLLEEVPVGRLHVHQRRDGLGGQGVVGARVDAQLTAGAVGGGDLHAILVARERGAAALDGDGAERGGGAGQLLGGGEGLVVWGLGWGFRSQGLGVEIAKSVCSQSRESRNKGEAPLTGRTAACGQTNAQMLHCVHAAASQVGTWSAMVRFSMAVVPGGKTPPGAKTLGSRVVGARVSLVGGGALGGYYFQLIDQPRSKQPSLPPPDGQLVALHGQHGHHHLVQEVGGARRAGDVDRLLGGADKLGGVLVVGRRRGEWWR